MSSSPRISVVIPCYNNAAYIAATLDSVLAQSLAPLEILVMDDGSTDGSPEIVSAYPPPVRLIRLAHANRASAMNRGFEAARGDFIGIVDGDDLWKPAFLERNIAALQADPTAVMVYCPAVVCDGHGRAGARQDGLPLPKPQVVNLLRKNHLCNSATLLRADALRAVGGYEAAYWPCDDYHLWLKLAARGKLLFAPEALAMYRVHGHQVTRNRAGMFRQMLAVKRAFLREHPAIASTLDKITIRAATLDWYIEACRFEHRRGNEQLAAEMSADCRRYFPWSLEALGLWLKNRIPWRLRRWLTLPDAFDPHARRVLNH